jgi:hypothetical protein
MAGVVLLTDKENKVENINTCAQCVQSDEKSEDLNNYASSLFQVGERGGRLSLRLAVLR